MIQKLLPLEALRGERHFRWRGGEVSRLEGLTDSVFGVALTLLIVRTDVPDDLDALLHSLRLLPAFAACFALFAMLWYYHFQFHRRFGLENLYTTVLNLGLLFLILIYSFPTKFVFTVLNRQALGEHMQFGTRGETLMLFYSGGVVGIFTLFALMHLYAYRHREVLELNAVEEHLTRTTIREHLIHVSVGLVSVLLALLEMGAWAGLIYFVVGPLQAINGIHSGRTLPTGPPPPAT
jgi:uncharacterized membrane protein